MRVGTLGPKLVPSGRIFFGGDGAPDDLTAKYLTIGGFPMDMTTSTRQVGDVTVVDISGRIVLGAESAALRDLVRDLLSEGHRKILFNLRDVHYIDSSGLGHLISAFTSVRKQGGELKLLNLTNKVHDVLQITRLYTVFDIIDDETAAIKSFAQLAVAKA
jgi:anti-sigma B factor antagonist